MADWSDFKPAPAAAEAGGGDWSDFKPADPPPQTLGRKLLGGAMTGLGYGARAVEGAMNVMGGGGPFDVKAPATQKEATQAAEGAIGTGGMMAGAMAGEATPLGPVGAVAGAGAGYEAADRLNQHINHYLFGDQVAPLSAPAQGDPNTVMGKVQNKLFNRPYGQAMQNVATGSGYEAIGRAAPAAITGLFGVKTAALEAQEAAAKQTAENLRQAQTLETSSEAGAEKLRKDVWEREKTAQERARTATESELKKTSEGKVKAEKEQVEKAQVEAEKAHLAEQEKQRGQLLGRTREQTAEALSPQPDIPKEGVAVAGKAELERKMAFRQSIYDEHERVGEYYGGQYQEFEKDFGEKNIPPRGLNQPGALNSTLKEIADRAPSAGDPNQLSPGLVSLIKKAGEVAEGKTYTEGPPDPATGQRALEEIQSQSGPTVSIMRKLRQAAQRTVGQLHRDNEIDMANSIADAADKSLEFAEGVPADKIKDLRELNRNYRDYKEVYKRDFLNKVAREPEPTNLAQDIFGQPKRANRLLAASSPTERQVYRDLAGDWFNKEGWSLKDIYENVDHNVLKNLYGDKFEAALPHAEADFEKLKFKLANEPATAKEFNEVFQRHYNEIKQEQMADVRSELMEITSKMGPAGQQLREEAKNALNTQAMMQVAQKVANMSKEDFLKALMSEQKTPLKSAREAVMAGKPSDVVRSLTRFTRFRGMFYTAVITGGALGGHVSPMMEGLGAVTAAMSVPVLANYAGRAVLKHEAIADIVADIAINPDKLGAVKKIAARSADLIAAMAANKAKQKTGGQEAATP